MRTSERATLRTLDANFNRSAEALRVIEDVVRFHLDDAPLQETVKVLRHKLAELRNLCGYARLLGSRDTPADVGTSVTTSSERARPNIDIVLQANFRRFSEALRVIEEHLKLPGLSGASEAEAIRYASYVLETSVLARSSRRTIEDARLIVLYDPAGNELQIDRMVGEFAALDGIVLQLRCKNCSDRHLLDVSGMLAAACERAGLPLIVNDRPDIALLCGALGVHLGTEDITAYAARRILGAGQIVGLSTHNEKDVHSAVGAADYIGAGPCFPSRTKEFSHFPGPEFAAKATRMFLGPVFAIGGITPDNLPRLLDLGVSRIAVSSAVCEADSPRAAAKFLLDMLPSPASHEKEG